MLESPHCIDGQYHVPAVLVFYSKCLNAAKGHGIYITGSSLCHEPIYEMFVIAGDSLQDHWVDQCCLTNVHKCTINLKKTLIYIYSISSSYILWHYMQYSDRYHIMMQKSTFVPFIFYLDLLC